jgi:hypothetical protein
VLGLLGGCSGNDPGPGSPVGQQSAGSGGNGGEAGTLDLGLEGGKGGGGAGGIGGAGGNGGTTSGGTAGAAAGGTGAAGSSSGSGGSKATGMCHRVTSSDPDCADFYSEEGYSQAHACDDIGAASQLTQMHGGKCASVSFVAGAKYGECCAP